MHVLGRIYIYIIARRTLSFKVKEIIPQKRFYFSFCISQSQTSVTKILSKTSISKMFNFDESRRKRFLDQSAGEIPFHLDTTINTHLFFMHILFSMDVKFGLLALYRTAPPLHLQGHISNYYTRLY